MVRKLLLLSVMLGCTPAHEECWAILVDFALSLCDILVDRLSDPVAGGTNAC